MFASIPKTKKGWIESVSNPMSRKFSTHLVNESLHLQTQVRRQVYLEKLTALPTEVGFKGSVTGPQNAESRGILEYLTFIVRLLGLNT